MSVDKMKGIIKQNLTFNDNLNSVKKRYLVGQVVVNMKLPSCLFLYMCIYAETDMPHLMEIPHSHN